MVFKQFAACMLPQLLDRLIMYHVGLHVCICRTSIVKGVAIKEHMEVTSSAVLAAKCQDLCKKNTAGMDLAGPPAGALELLGAAKDHECCTHSSACGGLASVPRHAAFDMLLVI